MQLIQDTSNPNTSDTRPSPIVEIIAFYLGCFLIMLIAVLIDTGFSIKILDVASWEGCEVAGACGIVAMFGLGMFAIIWFAKWCLVEILFFILWGIGYKLKFSLRLMSLLIGIFFLLASGTLHAITPDLYGSTGTAIIIGLVLGLLHLGWSFVARFAAYKVAQGYNSSRTTKSG